MSRSSRLASTPAPIRSTRAQIVPARIALALCASLVVAAACAPSRVTGPTTVASRPLTPREAAFVDTLEERTFRWFWDTTNPANGLTPDRYPTRSFSSVAAVGFALTAYPVGIERGYVSRADAAQRTLTTLRFFWTAPQGAQASGVTGYHGFFYHFLDMGTGVRFRTVELSTIDTSLLLGGVLFCREYYDQPGVVEDSIRALADSIYYRVDWQWARARPPLVAMGWTPEQGFHQLDWRGYDEAMVLYVLALGSPTHPVDPAAWSEWTRTYQWTSYYGEPQVPFPPLFGHQYSHVWIDFRGIRDPYMRGRGMDYFENSRRATLSQRAYAIANPRQWKGYSADVWGLTASDGPSDTAFVVDGKTRQFFSYSARGPATLEPNTRDDGTLAPTAAGGSIPFAPEVAVPALVAMRERYGGAIFNRYGFLDAFNLTWPDSVRPREGGTAPNVGWVDTDQLGIDQGPIVAMIENYRSGLVWKYMRRSPYVRRGLERAGFTGGWLVTP
ncbi:MAG TPA: glucoamylase family protein [Gemmatimonadaceae bacterium]|nr:glucoamylase family protein [Gemmatimonadaceae bacterium]